MAGETANPGHGELVDPGVARILNALGAPNEKPLAMLTLGRNIPLGESPAPRFTRTIEWLIFFDEVLLTPTLQSVDAHSSGVVRRRALRISLLRSYIRLLDYIGGWCLSHQHHTHGYDRQGAAPLHQQLPAVHYAIIVDLPVV